MNNKGFGLPELLLFVGISLFSLIAIAIYINTNLSNKKIIDKPSYDTLEDLTPANIEVPKEYKELENKLKEASLKYNKQNNETIIISLKKLKEAKILNNLTDPFDNQISCNGYVIVNKGKYTPYINCSGMYATKDYNTNFE